jgi:hypothetical protein
MDAAGTGAGKTVRNTQGALKGLGKWGVGVAIAVSSLSKMGRWRGGKADVTEGLLRASAQ